MRATSLKTGNERKGVILLVVLAMITLLTILGITFVLYSDSSEATARINLESEKIYQPEYTANELMQIAFGQLVFDVEDDVMGQQSAMRGHSLARDIYGYNYNIGGGPQPQNDRPFRGTGRLTNIPVNLPGGNENEKKLINFSTFYSGVTSEFVRDPERPNPGDRGTGNPFPYIGGFNPPYTYPDLNHVFLAKTDPTTGEVIEPSFVRREAMDTQNFTTFNLGPLGFNLGTPAPAWTTKNGKYQILRPRPFDHSPNFPGPSDDFGDVRNLPWGTHNDAIWMDLGVAPKVAQNGKKYKPLFAYTILDLDGRVNVNAHGNIHGRNQANGLPDFTHASRHGMGPWEVSLEKALTNDAVYTTNNAAWKSILLGGGIQGRFKATGETSSNYFPVFPSGTPHSHGPIDFNGSADPLTTSGPTFPQSPLPSFSSGNWFYSPFSQWISNRYGNFNFQEFSTSGSSNAPPFNHGSIFNPYGNYPTDIPPHKLFPDSHFGMLLARKTKNPKEYESSDFWNLQAGGSKLFGSFPFDSSSIRDKRYDRITTLSWDLDRPGIVPYIQDKSTQSLAFSSTISNPWNPNAPLGSTPVQCYPDSSNSPPIPFNLSVPTATSDYDSQYQSLLASAKRLNLQRVLPPYPATVNPTSGQYSGSSTSGDQMMALQALNARQDFAREILVTLCKSTGSIYPSEFSIANVTQITDYRYLATRWLAQLAVNMVDHFDTDSMMTVFNWDLTDLGGLGGEPVVGVELNRLLINESYVQVENKPGEHSSGNVPTGYRAKVYLELLNPLLKDTHDHSGAAKIGTNDIYRFEFVKPNSFSAVPNVLFPTNDNKMVGPILPGQQFLNEFSFDGWINSPIPFSNTNVNLKVKPNDGQSNGYFGTPSPSGNSNINGFMVIGPTLTSGAEGNGLGAGPGWTSPTSTFSDTVPDATGPSITWSQGDFFAQDKLWFPLTKVGGGASIDMNLNMIDQNNLPIVLLRRLANPYMPLDETPTSLTYNPYVTVDMVQITKQMLIDNDARKKVPNGMMSGSTNNTAPTNTDITQRVSYGRKISNHHIPPFASSNIPVSSTFGQVTLGGLTPQDPTYSAPNTDNPKHTFWRHNFKDPINGPTPSGDTFNPPRFQQHLDRAPISIGELLTVPTCKPHEVYWLNNPYQDLAAGWLDPKTRLYRFLEMVQAGNVRYLNDMSNNIVPIGSEGGRIPGKINLNTCTKEVFRALCDQNPNNRFNPNQVDEIFAYIESKRPFWGFGLGEYVGPADFLGFNPGLSARGLINSLLHNQHTDGSDAMNLWNLLLDPQNIRNNNGFGVYPALFGTNRNSQVPNGPAEIPLSLRLELFNKTVGNSTTRSNCFAVWLTVGFFEVVSEDGIPGHYTQKYILGKELQPRTRKRFFSLIDRTQLETWRFTVTSGTNHTGPVALSSLGLGTTFTSPVTNKVHPITAASPAGSIPANQATILTINPDSIFEETVEVENILGIGLGVRLKNTHPVPFQIINRGNPGPIPSNKLNLDDLQKRGLIPYFQVLE